MNICGVPVILYVYILWSSICEIPYFRSSIVLWLVYCLWNAVANVVFEVGSCDERLSVEDLYILRVLPVRPVMRISVEYWGIFSMVLWLVYCLWNTIAYLDIEL